MKLLKWPAFLTLSMILLAGCGSATPRPTANPSGSETLMSVTSDAFQNGASIPTKYSCDGENINPAIHWSGVPIDVKSLAIIVEDPDAPGGTFYHWVVYNIPPSTTSIQEGLPVNGTALTQGKTSFNATGYGGPCPPKGKLHHYYFHVYALDLAPTLGVGMNANGLKKAMEGHILQQNDVMGTFQH